MSRRQEQRKRTGEGGMHTILDSIVVKRGATAGQVQVHRRCRYACSMPCSPRRTPRSLYTLWRSRETRLSLLLLLRSSCSLLSFAPFPFLEHFFPQPEHFTIA